MHIVLAGINYRPQRSTGDKNFWVDLMPFFAKKIRKITILSVRQDTKKYDNYEIGDCLVTVRYLFPHFPETPDIGREQKRIFWRSGAFRRGLGAIEKALNVSRICKELKRLYSEDPYDFVHLMDNFGPGNKIIAKNAFSGVSVSAVSYHNKTGFLYDLYLSACYKHPGFFVVPYSGAYYDKLISLGVNKDSMAHIPWGARISPGENNAEERRNKKKAFSFPSNKPIILWVGYIQQVGRKDFLFAVETAREALKKGLDCIFYFAFKPESFEKEFISFHDPGRGMYVGPTTTEEFDALKHCADIFYSPIMQKGVIVAPPLTWVEMLGLGVPVLTTRVSGADEIVLDGKTGYMSDSRAGLIEKLFMLRSQYGEMMPACREKAACSYNIERISEKYMELWFSYVKERQG